MKRERRERDKLPWRNNHENASSETWQAKLNCMPHGAIWFPSQFPQHGGNSPDKNAFSTVHDKLLEAQTQL